MRQNTMKPLADWIRMLTPGWTDEQRYKIVAGVHTWLPPVCLAAFLFTNSIVARFLVLCLQTLTLSTELLFRDCIVTMVEREFSDSTWDDMFAKLFKAIGWDISRSEKMTFNIGLNFGLLIMTILMLLRESVMWMVGFTSIVVTALPSAVLLSTILHSPSIAELPLPQTPLP
jgi:hypothetical protein